MWPAPRSRNRTWAAPESLTYPPLILFPFWLTSAPFFPEVTISLTLQWMLVLPSSECHVNDILQFIFVGVWPFFTLYYACDLIQAGMYSIVHWFSLPSSIRLCEQTTVYPFCYWWIFELFQVQITLLLLMNIPVSIFFYTCTHFCWIYSQGWGCWVTGPIGISCVHTVQWFSELAVPLQGSTPASGAGESQFLYIFSYTWCGQSSPF